MTDISQHFIYQREPVYLCSGHMINHCFGTKHNDPESMWLLTPKGFEPATLQEIINEKFIPQGAD